MWGCGLNLSVWGYGEKVGTCEHGYEYWVFINHNTRIIKVTFFWDISSPSLLGTDQHFGGRFCNCHPEDGGSIFTRNITRHLSMYTARHRRWQ
jgi:hypothetical protein